MRDDGSTAQPGDSAESRAALLAGAALLKRWIVAQRATWSDLDTDLARISTPVQAAAPLIVTAPLVAPLPVAAPPAAVAAAPSAAAPAAVAAATPPTPAPIRIAPVVVVQTPAPPVDDDRPVLQLSNDGLHHGAAPGGVAPWALPPQLPDLSGAGAPADGLTADASLPLEMPAMAGAAKPRVNSAWIGRAAAVAAAIGVLGMGGYAARGVFSRVTAKAETGTAVIESTEAAAVFVDGKEQGTTPLKLELTPGKHALEFRRNGATRSMSVEITAGQSAVTRAEWGTKKFGTLEVTTLPAGVKVLVDGKERGVTPLTLSDVAAGPHAVVLQTGENTIKRSVTVVEEKTARLNEEIFSGFIHVSAGIEIQMAESKRAIRLDNRNQALLGPGTHEIRFTNRTFGYDEVRTVDVKAGAITEITIEAPTSLLSVTATVPGEVFVDGTAAGPLPLTDFPVRVGTREIMVKSADGERKVLKTVTTAPLHVEVDFSAP